MIDLPIFMKEGDILGYHPTKEPGEISMFSAFEFFSGFDQLDTHSNLNGRFQLQSV